MTIILFIKSTSDKYTTSLYLYPIKNNNNAIYSSNALFIIYHIGVNDDTRVTHLKNIKKLSSVKH